MEHRHPYGGQQYYQQDEPFVKDSEDIKKLATKVPFWLWIALGIFGVFLVLLLLHTLIEEHDHLFVAAEAVHFTGIGFLVFKLVSKQSCAGISLRSQVLTAVFLGIRLVCSWAMEYDIHTLLDFMTLVATLFAIAAVLLQLYSTYQADADVIKEYFILVPCVLLALIAHPNTKHHIAFRILWASCVYIEAVSVLPQMIMMQKLKVVEKFTGHYVFALGVSRFLSCAHWIFQLINKDSFLIMALFKGIWPSMVLLAEAIQTFILADFCFYYIKSYSQGRSQVQLPHHVV